MSITQLAITQLATQILACNGESDEDGTPLWSPEPNASDWEALATALGHQPSQAEERRFLDAWDTVATLATFLP